MKKKSRKGHVKSVHDDNYIAKVDVKLINSDEEFMQYIPQKIQKNWIL